VVAPVHQRQGPFLGFVDSHLHLHDWLPFFTYTEFFGFWPFSRFRTSGQLPENPAQGAEPVPRRRWQRHDWPFARTRRLALCFQVLVKLPADHVEFILPVKIIQ
jgi:hypothetical protein